MGFVVCGLAWTLGDFGGGHFNPAVSIAMAASMKITVFRGMTLVFMIGVFFKIFMCIMVFL